MERKKRGKKKSLLWDGADSEHAKRWYLCSLIMYKWQLSGEWFSADIRNIWKLWRTGPSLISLAVPSRQQEGGITWLCAASAQELTQPQGTSNTSCLWYLGSWFGSAINGWERVASLPRQLSAMDNVFWELNRKPKMLQKKAPSTSVVFE